MYACLRFLPKNHLSYVVGRLARVSLPGPLQQLVNGGFVRAAGIDMEEAEFPLRAYSSVSKLFTRRLKPHLRPLHAGIVCPVDGTLRTHGDIENDTLPQVKERTYSLSRFIGDDLLAKRFSGGYFFNLYLSPRDYHRVHNPLAGEIVFRRHIPGKLWPVNDWSMSRIDGLFTINERVVIGIQTALGLMLVVMVGATNVGRISLSFESLITNNPCSGELGDVFKQFEPGLSIKAGEELGIFHLGSTVVLMFEPGKITSVAASLGKIKLGQSLSVPKEAGARP